jgi:D-3-phosphoglycerate dehydrogenase
MKGVAVGDLFIPKERMAELFGNEKVRKFVSEISMVEFRCKDRDEIRRKMRNIEANGPDSETAPSDLRRLLKEADILAVHLCPVPRSILEHANKLRVVCTARGGVDNIDMAALNERRIPVINTPHHNTNAVAEYVLGLMIAETRNIARSHSALKSGAWRERYANTECIPELSGSKIGILGFGQIGRAVVKKLQPFNVEILVCDPYVNTHTVEELGYRSVDLETLLRESDIISLHVRLMESTRRMIGERELRSMKQSSYIINTARAGLIDLDALVRALKENWISGAAIDVFEEEPAPKDHPLFTLDNVTVTNHRAGDTRNAYWAAPLLMGEQLALFLHGQKPQFVANPEVLEPT